MTEQKLHLEIPLLIPGLESDQDSCISRLEGALQPRRGIQQAHVERDGGALTLCLHYDPALLSVDDVRRMAERTGAQIANRYHHVVIPIEGMDCSDCALVVEHSLARMEGVLSASISYAAEIVRVEYDTHATNRAAIEKRIRQIGYSVPASGVRRAYGENRELLFSLGAGILLLAGWLGGRFLAFPAPLSVAFYLAAYIAGGYDISRHALHALREREFDTDLLMVVAALGAAILGDFAEGALLLFLFSLGHSLEERALNRARNAVRALADLAPKTALVRSGSGETETPVDRVALGAVVIVRPGVRMPVDGVVISGESAMDQSPVTGESAPVDKGPGNKVFAGSVNGQGALEVQVTRLAKDSTLARVMQMVEEAQTQKSPTQQMTERFTRVFVPAILIGAVLVIIVPPLLGVPFSESFLRAMTLLVAASPCALALGTPSAVLAGVAQAARHGVLIKGGAHLENLGHLQAIAFDKTGTLTSGRPTVTGIFSYGVTSEDQLLALAAAVESRSAHPLAQAVVAAAQERGLAIPAVTDASAMFGRGTMAEIDGQTARVGSVKLFDEAGMDVSQQQRDQVNSLESEGKTTMLVSLGRQMMGLITVADTQRPGVQTMLAALQRLGVRHTVMLTGDNERVAARVASEIGVTDFRAGMMPEDKVKAVQDMVDRYSTVAMVGDGVNDAPALATATVGIAMGGAGTDVALETADIALMADDLSKLPFAVGLGRATRAIIQQNLIISLGVIAVLVTMAISGVASIGTAIVFHEGSTIAVVLNALRLLGYRSE